MSEKRYFGRLGAGHLESEKPVILFDDYEGNCREFETVGEAIAARDKESQVNEWAALKMIFQFNQKTSEFEIQTRDCIDKIASGA